MSRYNKTSLEEQLASRLRKDGAAPGKHELIFEGRRWSCEFDGRSATLCSKTSDPDMRRLESFRERKELAKERGDEVQMMVWRQAELRAARKLGARNKGRKTE